MTTESPAKLIIFDVDGTLADRDTNELLPGVYEWFEKHGGDHKLAIATNQGGVGLRHWMETDKFGQPDKYPSEREARVHIARVLSKLPESIRDDIHALACFAYQSRKSGKWSPIPDGRFFDYEWNEENRKPAPGMLNLAMAQAEAKPHETIMVGDRDEDRQAAEAAGCHFQDADWFFGRKTKA